MNNVMSDRVFQKDRYKIWNGRQRTFRAILSFFGSFFAGLLATMALTHRNRIEFPWSLVILIVSILSALLAWYRNAIIKKLDRELGSIRYMKVQELFVYPNLVLIIFQAYLLGRSLPYFTGSMEVDSLTLTLFDGVMSVFLYLSCLMPILVECYDELYIAYFSFRHYLEEDRKSSGFLRGTETWLRNQHYVLPSMFPFFHCFWLRNGLNILRRIYLDEAGVQLSVDQIYYAIEFSKKNKIGQSESLFQSLIPVLSSSKKTMIPANTYKKLGEIYQESQRLTRMGFRRPAFLSWWREYSATIQALIAVTLIVALIILNGDRIMKISSMLFP